MNVRLHIERLILDDLPIVGSQRALVQGAVERELARLIEVNGVGPDTMAGGARPSVSPTVMHMAEGMTPVQLGRQIAQAVYQGVGNHSSAKRH
ncbi:MAG: hypothetical protein P0120_23725 [Nitrospira sp.]|nr:hypothetical protein [Nitrospira sp.]